MDHRSTFRCVKTNTKLTSHLSRCAHSRDSFEWVVLEHIPYSHDHEAILFEREQRWVFRLKTSTLGLNEDIPWNALSG